MPDNKCGIGSMASQIEPDAPPSTDKYQQPGDCALPMGDPVLDPDNTLQYINTTYVQLAPWKGPGEKIIDDHTWTGGWTTRPGNGYGCNTGESKEGEGWECYCRMLFMVGAF